jgi:hypothetical protein
MVSEDRPYVVHSDTRITLTPLAREMAKLNGMSEREMAKHLLTQHRMEQAGLTQREGES